MHLCLLHWCLRLACVHACTRKSGLGRPSPSPFCALKNEGGNLRAAVIIHPSKQMGRRQRRSRVGGRDGCGERERSKQEGEAGWDILTLISLYLAFCIPGCTLFCILSLSHTQFLLSFFFFPFSSFQGSCLFLAYLTVCARGCVSSLRCLGWYTVCTNIFCVAYFAYLNK